LRGEMSVEERDVVHQTQRQIDLSRQRVVNQWQQAMRVTKVLPPTKTSKHPRIVFLLVAGAFVIVAMITLFAFWAVHREKPEPSHTNTLLNPAYVLSNSVCARSPA